MTDTNLLPCGITMERDFFGTIHIKVGDFDYVQVKYQYPYTDNASTRRLAERIAAMLAAPTPEPASPQMYDDVLLPFLALMRKELHANSGKGGQAGWLKMDVPTALLEIFYHMGKLQKAAKDADYDGIREYSADVANMTMMLADICGVLPSPEQPAKEVQP